MYVTARMLEDVRVGQRVGAGPGVVGACLGARVWWLARKQVLEGED